MTEESVEKKSRRRRVDAEDSEEIEYDTDGNALTAGKGRVTPGRRNKQTTEESGNFFVRVFRTLREYFEGVQDELDKVVWPTREELFRLARIVGMVTISASIVLGIISIGFTQLFRFGLEDPIIFVVFAVVMVAAYFGLRSYFQPKDASDIKPF
jgi:preprotein translocase SecE subunit